MTDEPIEFPVEGLVDDVIRLRLGSDADIPRLVEACQDPAIQRYTTIPDRYGEVNAREFARQSAIAQADGSALTLAIADVETDALLGTVGVRRRATGPGRWSVGYWVAPWARGRGVAVRAVELVSSFAFDELGATRIELWAEPENEPSLQVAERAGFTREGLLRSYITIKGSSHDVYMYSLLPSEQR